MCFVLIIVISFIATDIWHDQQHWVLNKSCVHQPGGRDHVIPPSTLLRRVPLRMLANHRLSGLSPAFSSTCYILLSPEGNQPPAASRLPLAKCILNPSCAADLTCVIACSGQKDESSCQWLGDEWKISPPLGCDNDIKQPNNHETNHQMVQDFFSIHSIFWY